MKNYILILLLLYVFKSHSQSKTTLINQSKLETDNFVGCDYDFNLYYFTNTILSKKTTEETLNYSNFLYGNITSVDITNPLKIVVFYKDYNVVIILDSQLNETDIIQLPYDVLFATKGTANNIWLYTTNTQIIENYNYKTNTIVSQSQPLRSTVVLGMKSTENNVYIQTEQSIKTFDYMGNYIQENKTNSIDEFQYNNRVQFILSNDTLYTSKSETKFSFPSITNIKNFYTINNHIFIFDGSELYLFSTDKK